MSTLPATTAANRIARQQDTPGGRQFLTFSLGGEMFAIPLEHIREIIEFGGLTEIPMMPDFLRGVINLRGAVVPVIDLAARFGRAPTAIARRTCIVILEVLQEEQLMPLGVIVDAVSEVLAVEHSQIEPRPSFGAKIRAEFIEGMINHHDKFVVALDIQHVLSVDEMASLIGFGAVAAPD
ncbi:chemotaxis protein CheW [Niveibacterium umoris]|uniref:Purine-binding chemotaxis protein CheW n=1 Tax=Niveibacterium umoris TaxID=1193620 RepID=A0A840BNW2_9RHOO|nr:chemotaxis protein CheW [Niveibacterium umoris]MBB4014313.1 purine-binding chemotaxis protein CheW [Niveibacterium umoris]